MIEGLPEAIDQAAKLITKAACDDPPRPANCLLDDPSFRRRDHFWFVAIRVFMGFILLGVIAFAAWLYFEFSR